MERFIGGEFEDGRDVVHGVNEKAASFLAVLQEEFDNGFVDEEAELEVQVGEEFEFADAQVDVGVFAVIERANAFAAEFHVVAVEREDLSVAVVFDDEFFFAPINGDFSLARLAESDCDVGLGAVGQFDDCALRVGNVDVGAFAAESFHFFDGLAADFALMNRQFARHGQRVKPAVFSGRNLVDEVGHTNPANHDVARFIGEDLRGVEVETFVEFMELAVNHVEAVDGEMPDEVAGEAVILITELLVRDALRADDEHVHIFELQEVGAFPHVTEIVIIGFDFAEEFPAALRFFLVDEDCAVGRARALCGVTHALRGHGEVTDAVAIEEVGVTEMRGVTFGVAVNLNLVELNGAVLLQRAEALRDRANVIFIAGIAGVEDANLAVLREAAAAVATVLVVLVTRPEGEFGHGVVDEIFRRGVHPRFILVPLLIFGHGVPLAEDVIGAVAANQAVRVADEGVGRVNVEAVVPASREGNFIADALVDGLLVEFRLDALQSFSGLLCHKNSSLTFKNGINTCDDQNDGNNPAVDGRHGSDYQIANVSSISEQGDDDCHDHRADSRHRSP